MPGNQWDNDDDQLYPNSKYKGILYAPRRAGAQDDDFPVARQRKRARRSVKNAGGFDMILVENGGEERNAREGEPAFGKAFRSRSGKPSKERPRPAAFKGEQKKNHRKRAYSYDVKPLGFWGDRLIKVTVAVCATVAVVSWAAIPMAFAKPAVDITLNDGGRVLEAPTSAQTVGEFL